MTACSNHPGTPAGLALTELLGAAESIVRALREAEEAWCESVGISRNLWLELRAMQRSQGAAVLAGASPVLLSKQLVEVCPGGYRLSGSGRELLWTLDRQRFDWVDTHASKLAARDLRQQAAALRRLSGKLSS